MAPYIDTPDDIIVSEKSKLPQIHCSGTPYEIGYQHGREARLQISRTIDFYGTMFEETCKMNWDQVQEVAMTFEPVLSRKWPRYLEEIRGVADGAEVKLSDIVACNVRTEIAFGLFSDGCTALSWRTDDTSFLAQNWDWDQAQKQNLVVLTIEQADKPTIKMVTEAGLIGKIGLNSAGVGVCLNAIRMKGMDPTKLPCHLGLRLALESQSREEAVQQLEECGVASSCHMLIADETGGVGLEWSSTEMQKCTMNEKKQVFHSNHFIQEHPALSKNSAWLGDSSYRVTRIEELAQNIEKAPTQENIRDIFKDESNSPGAICRAQKGVSSSATLFNIVMDLRAKRADVILGRPTEPEAFVQLAF